MTSTASASDSDQAFLGVATLLFVASAATTIVWCASMSAMGSMPMPGGWTMSMAWMRMPGQSWADAAAMFLGMWVVMMVAMMLPSLVPMLWRYRQAVATTGETRLGRLTALVSIGYFFVWTVVGAVVFSVGAAISAIAMNQPAVARAVPIAAGAILLVVGVMDLVAMAVVAAAITVERVLPAGERVARMLGVVIIATGLLLIARV